MRTHHLLVTSILSFGLMSPVCLAQEGLRIGLTGTAQSVWMFNQDDSDAGPEFDYIKTWAPAFGLALDYHFTPQVGVGTSFIYSVQGQRYDIFDVKFHNRLTYFKVPVMFVFNSDPSSNSQFLFRVGPTFGFLNSASIMDDGGSELVISDLNGNRLSDHKELYNSTDIGAMFALGAMFNASDVIQVSASFRADYGLVDIENSDYKPDDRKLTRNITGGIEVGVFYLISSKTGE